MSEGQLLAIHWDGEMEWVPCTYEGIKRGLRDAVLDFRRAGEHIGVYINDNGMLDGSPLNMTASILFGHPLYGSVVFAAAYPDAKGDTLPADEEHLRPFRGMARMVKDLHERAAQVGQSLSIVANPDTVPAPTITPITNIEDLYGAG